jgi:IS5 family transposase
MRQQQDNIFSELFQDDEIKVPKIVQEYRDTYNKIDALLRKYPELLKAAHHDLQALCKPDSSRQREPDFTTENLFRAILVMKIENVNYRRATILIAESKTLQNFCRLYKKETINHSLLCYAHNALSPETWQTINRHFALQMKKEKKIDLTNIRTDTTVVETNIHYPTDSSLLWDTYRTIDRLWTKALDGGLSPVLPDYRFNPIKIKKLYLEITRFANSKGKERKKLVKSNFKVLIARTGEALVKAKEIVKLLTVSGNDYGISIGVGLSSYFPAMEKVVDAARRRQAGEQVPVADKVFSIFESHTELIQRGRRDKPIEFGHKIMLAQTKEKFISDYEVYALSPSDTTLLSDVVERHKELYRRYPLGVAADMGFHPGAEEFEELLEEYEDKVEYFGVPGRLRDFGDTQMSLYQRWRAGIEGTISCLKRAFHLGRLLFKGFKNFSSGVGGAIFCHNLLTVVRMDE